MNPLSIPQCQHQSHKECQMHIEKVQAEWGERNVLLILSLETSTEETCKNLCHNSLFSGILVLDNFDNHGQKRIEFKLTDRKIPIKVIKENISLYLNKKTTDIALARLPTSGPLKDDDDCFNTLNFNGLGGEIIHLRFVPSK